MQHVERSALVPYTAEQMLALVEDIARYPEFVPGCLEATVERAGDPVRASLAFRFAGLTERFATENRRTVGADGVSTLDLRLLSGPFKQLSGAWRFQALGESGCKITLRVAMDWGRFALGRLLNGQLDRSVGEVMQAFRQRAETLYGARRV